MCAQLYIASALRAPIPAAYVFKNIPKSHTSISGLSGLIKISVISLALYHSVKYKLSATSVAAEASTPLSMECDRKLASKAFDFVVS